MSQGGRTYANTPYTTLRVPPREDRPPRTYEPDPAAVARLKAHFAAEQAERERQKLEAVRRAAERVRARRKTKAVEMPPAEEAPAQEVTVTKRNKPFTLAAEMTPERAARWAAWRREGWSYDAITKEDELHPSLPSIKDYLRKYGYDFSGRKVGAEEEMDSPETVATTKRNLEERIRRVEETEPPPALVAASNNGAVLAAPVGGDVTHQLAALQQLVSTLSASDVRLSGRIRVELVAEIAL